MVIFSWGTLYTEIPFFCPQPKRFYINLHLFQCILHSTTWDNMSRQKRKRINLTFPSLRSSEKIKLRSYATATVTTRRAYLFDRVHQPLCWSTKQDIRFHALLSSSPSSFYHYHRCRYVCELYAIIRVDFERVRRPYLVLVGQRWQWKRR